MVSTGVNWRHILAFAAQLENQINDNPSTESFYLMNFISDEECARTRDTRLCS